MGGRHQIFVDRIDISGDIEKIRTQSYALFPGQPLLLTTNY